MEAEKELKDMLKLQEEEKELLGKLSEENINALKNKELSNEKLTPEEYDLLHGSQTESGIKKRLEELKRSMTATKVRPILPKIEVEAIKVKPPKLKRPEYFGKPSLVVG